MKASTFTGAPSLEAARAPALPHPPAAPGALVPRCRRSADAGDADQVALGVGEVADDQARRSPLGAHQALPAQALGPGQGGLDVGHGDVEDGVALVARAAADAAGDPGPVAGGHAVDEAVARRVRHRLGDRRGQVELPAEQLAEVVAQFSRVLPDDLEVHYRLAHNGSLRVPVQLRRAHRPKLIASAVSPWTWRRPGTRG